MWNPSPKNSSVWVQVFALVNDALLLEKTGMEWTSQYGQELHNEFVANLNGLEHESKEATETRKNEVQAVIDLMEELQLNNTRVMSTFLPILALYATD